MARSSSDRRSVKQSFWSHQLTEYVLGAAILTQGLGGGVRVVPIVAGALVLMLAATADGPLALVKLVPRPLHRFADMACAALIVVLALVLRDDGIFDMTVGLVCAAVVLFLVVRTDYQPPTRRGLFGRQGRTKSATSRASDGGSPTGASTFDPPDVPGAPGRPSTPARSEQIGRTAGRLAGRAARLAVDRSKGGRDARG